ncbi:MAG: hypothetical protein K2L11_00365 [Muribaculaceae bacterium]|nr:hypothetical protein [Muribaculaceae bacterium]
MHNRRDSGPSGLRPVEGDLRCTSCFSGMPGTGMSAVDRQASGLSAWTYRMHPSYALKEGCGRLVIVLFPGLGE